MVERGTPRTTQLVGGPHDGQVDPICCIEGDTVVVDQRARYIGTGRVTTSGHWEAVHDDMDPRRSRAATAGVVRTT